ncbi:MAG TPA: 30S ribosomal protein S12 methylthiotransferase RimO [Candidatus Aquicultor sp.]
MLKKATVITLGCAKNSVDSEHIKGSLVKHGIELTENAERADYIVINTCGFIEAAKAESINTILELAELKSQSKPKQIIVTGCLAQRYYDDLMQEIPEIDLLVDLRREFEIADLIRNGDGTAHDAHQTTDHRDFSTYPERVLSGLPYAYLQIADGCDNRCSYCAIPMIRGPYASKPLEQIVEEARWLDGRGIKEINLIAQDTSRYGYDLYGRNRLTELLNALDDFENIAWIRLLYLQPYFLNDELINSLQTNKYLLPYIDIPFQHASSKILHAMNRHGAGTDYLAQIAWLRRAIPDIVLRTSVMVGFPGETEDDFKKLVDFVEQAEFDYLGVFQYSEEEGTKAAGLEGAIPEEIKNERYHQVVALQDLIGQRRSENRLEKPADVLIESNAESGLGVFEGRAWWQTPEVDGYTYVTGDVKPGSIVTVEISEFDGCDFHGRPLGGVSK